MAFAGSADNTETGALPDSSFARGSVRRPSLIGLVPVLGDLAGVFLSGYILREAAGLGASRSILARMAFNVALEGLVGMIPFAGDVFDAAYKANQRNVRLLNDYWPAEAARWIWSLL
jgi:hypothetical protein